MKIVSSYTNDVIYVDTVFGLLSWGTVVLLKRQGVSNIYQLPYLTQSHYDILIRFGDSLLEYFDLHQVFSYSTFSRHLTNKIGIKISDFVDKRLLDFSMQEVGALIEADLYNFLCALNSVSDAEAVRSVLMD